MKKNFVLGIGLIVLTLSGFSCMSKENTVTTKSGLKYTIIKEADSNAKSPQKGKRVKVHYTGWIEEDGKEGRKFDSSVDRKQPFIFIVGVSQVIKGWDEGVMLMKVGEKRRFFIPSDSGYGAHGIPGRIPGGATLIFDVELLDAEPFENRQQ